MTDGVQQGDFVYYQRHSSPGSGLVYKADAERNWAEIMREQKHHRSIA